MKKTILSLFALLVFMSSFSQSRITVTDYNKVQEPAVENEIMFPEKTVSKAIQEKLENKGYKGKDSKGFTIYRGVKVPELGPDNYDLYFRIEKKSKRDKDISTITLMLTKGTEVFVSEATDTQLVQNAKDYLESLKPIVAAYDLEQQIKEQEEVVKKADKKLSGLIDDGKDLVKKQKKIEDQIKDNDKAMADQKGELEKQRQIFDTLKNKRK